MHPRISIFPGKISKLIFRRKSINQFAAAWRPPTEKRVEQCWSMWYNVLVVLAEILTTGRRWAHGHNYLFTGDRPGRCDCTLHRQMARRRPQGQLMGLVGDLPL